MRKQDTNFDEFMKSKQRSWVKTTRNKRKQKSNITESSTNNQTPSRQEGQNQSSNKTPASIRKRAQRVKTKLPESPKTWAKTINHIVKNATQRRQTLPLKAVQGNSIISDLEETCEVNKLCRPKKSLQGIRKSLAFSKDADKLWRSKHNLQRYRSRVKTIKPQNKPRAYIQKWQVKVEQFLQNNSKAMPNKKGTIMINGETVGKRHLLCSKLALYKKFKKENPDYSRKFTTFLKMVSKNYKSLDQTCRKVCICINDYNIEQKVEALNKVVAPELKTTVRQLSDETLCHYETLPNRKCIDRKCSSGGTKRIQLKYVESLLGNEMTTTKFYQWEIRKESLEDGKPVKPGSIQDVLNDCIFLVIYADTLASILEFTRFEFSVSSSGIIRVLSQYIL